MIARVRPSDSGTYKCVATNHIGASEALAKVVVRGEADVVLLSIKAFEHPTPTPRCRGSLKLPDVICFCFFRSVIQSDMNPLAQVMRSKETLISKNQVIFNRFAYFGVVQASKGFLMSLMSQVWGGRASL